MSGLYESGKNRHAEKPHKQALEKTCCENVVRGLLNGRGAPFFSLQRYHINIINRNNYDSSFSLIVDLGTINVTTAGVKSISTTLKLGQGAYGFAIISNGAPKLMAGTTNLIELGLSPNTYQSNPISHWYEDGASQFTALPATTFGAMAAVMNSAAPQPMIKGGVQ